MKMQKSFQILLGVIVPLAMIAIILASDVIEGPKTAYVGVLAAVPLFSAIFGTPAATTFIALATWVSAFVFGHVASDGNTRSQTVRLVIIAIFGVVAVLAAILRVRRDRQFAEALKAAAEGEAMRVLAYTDPLSGLLNRRGVLARLSENEGIERTLALVDIDELKAVNDQHGHLIGDDYIVGVGARIVGGLSRQDIVGRWGGDEFLIILDLAADDGTRVMERLFDQMTAEPLSTPAGVIPFAVSIGVTTWFPGEAIEPVLVRADDVLYEAKQLGGNRLETSARVREPISGD